MFSPNPSLYHKRLKYMNFVKQEDEDFTMFACILNNQFKLAELGPDYFEYLTFVQVLVSTKDAEIRRKVLNKLENEHDLTLQNLAEDYQQIRNVRQDAKDIEVSGVLHIKKMREEIKVKKRF